MTPPRKVSAEVMATRLQKTLAQNVKQAREQLGLTQRDLAVAADMSQRHVAMIETTGSNPTILTLARLAKCLDTSVVNLLTPPARKPATAKFIDAG